MTKNHFLIASTILVVAGIVAFAVFHSKQQDNHSCINNLRAIDIDAASTRMYECLHAFVLSNVPPGTAFSKVVAVLGSDYAASKTNAQESFYANFYCVLPGMTNQSGVTFLVRSNVVVWTTYIKTGYPMGSPEPPGN